MLSLRERNITSNFSRTLKIVKLKIDLSCQNLLCRGQTYVDVDELPP